MGKQLLSLILIFQFIFFANLAQASNKDAAKECEDTNKYPTEVSKNNCLAEKGILVNQASDFKSAGTSALEITTFLLLTLSFIELQTAKAKSAEGKQATYFAYQITPYMAMISSLGYIATLIIYNEKFKNSCKEVINSSNPKNLFASQSDMGDDKSEGITKECKKLPEPKNNEEDKNRLSQISQFCKAEICTNKQIDMAKTQKDIITAIEIVMGAAVVIELANVIINVVQGAAGCIPPATTNTCATLQDYYGYALAEDVEVKGADTAFIRNNPQYFVETFKSENILNKNINQLIAAQNKLDSSLILSEYQRSIQGRNHSLSLKQYEHVQQKLILESSSSNPFKQFSKTLMNQLFIPSAQAMSIDVGNVLSGLGAIAGFALLKSTHYSVKQFVKKLYTTPMGRMALYAYATSLVDKQRTHIKNVVLPNLENRKTVFDTEIKALFALGQNYDLGDTTVNAPPLAVSTPKPNKTNPDLIQDEFKTCLTENLTIDEKCTCKAKKTCLQTTMPSIKLGDFKLPKDLLNSTSALTDYTSAEASGDHIKGENLLAGNLNGQKVFELLDKTKKQYLDEAKKAKTEPINFEKNNNKVANELSQLIKKSMPAEAIKGLENNQLAGVPPLDLKAKQDKESEVIASLIAPQQKVGSSSEDLNLLNKEEKNNEYAFLGQEDGPIDESKKFKIPEINNQADHNIFQILSRRYLKSAYPKLLEEDK
jgi:hypothetical protein